MPSLKNHEVWIETGGQRYEEYDVKVEGDVVTCYIASQAGKSFQIGWKSHVEPLNISSGIIFKLDGTILDTAGANHEAGMRSCCSKGYRIDESSLKAYTFADVQLTDDGGISTLSNDFGTICIDVHRVFITSIIEDYVHVPYDLPGDMGMPINERSKKIGGHRVNLSNAVKQEGMSGKLAMSLPYDGGDSPFATFRFVYRSKDILQALDIIPIAPLKGNKRMGSSPPVAGPSRSRREDNVPRTRKKIKTEMPVIDLSNDDDEAEMVNVKREVKTEDKNGINHFLNLSQFTLDENGAIDLTRE